MTAVYLPKDALEHPMYATRKLKSLRDINASKRLEILKLIAKKEMTAAEIGERYQLKAQAVRDLNKSRTWKLNRTIKKKESEISKAR